MRPDVTTARVLAAVSALMILAAVVDVCEHFDVWRLGVVTISVVACLLALTDCRKPNTLADDTCSLDRIQPCESSSRSSPCS